MNARSPIVWSLALVLAATLALIASAGRDPAEIGERVAAVTRTETVLSPVYDVKRKYRSMQGPYSSREVLLEEGSDELLWITGYRAVMVGADGETPRPQEFMCHSNLDVDLDVHARTLGINPAFSPRLFTLSQGQLEVRFPPGFGVPLLASEPLSLTTQVLNLNHEGKKVEVRHKVSIDYVRQSDLDFEMQALFPTSAYGLALLEGDGSHFGLADADEEVHGPGCLPGKNASHHEYDDGLGRVFTGHWIVPPGRQVNRTLVTRLMRIPYDTRVHYVAVHLHPFAESLELRDLTTGETLFRSAARNFPDRIGLAHVDSYSSVEGLPVYADHEYELVSVYDNPTGEEQDSMAVMYIYLRDLEFDPRRQERRQRAP